MRVAHEAQVMPLDRQLERCGRRCAHGATSTVKRGGVDAPVVPELEEQAVAARRGEVGLERIAPAASGVLGWTCR